MKRTLEQMREQAAEAREMLASCRLTEILGEIERRGSLGYRDLCLDIGEFKDKQLADMVGPAVILKVIDHLKALGFRVWEEEEREILFYRITWSE